MRTVKNIIIAVSRVFTYFLPFLRKYKYSEKVTFGLTDFHGVMGHEQYAKIFGKARELFGFERIPGFAKDAGYKYLLKTCDASFKHFADYHFGDTIKLVLEVTNVNGASFHLTGNFFNQRGALCANACQMIAYANMSGMPVRFPSWMRFLLKSIERKTGNGKAKKANGINGQLVFENKIVVTSQMTNAEMNVNHNDYVSLMSESIETYLLGRAQKDFFQKYLLKVEEGLYKYKRDFYFGDKIVIRLFTTEKGADYIVYEAEFINEKTGLVHAYGKQKVVYKPLAVLDAVSEKTLTQLKYSPQTF